MSTLSYDFTALSIEDPISVGGEWETAVGAGVYIISNAGTNNAASRVSDLQHASNIKTSKAVYGSKQYSEVIIGPNTPVGYSLGPGCFMSGDNSYFIAIQSIGGVADNRVYKNVAGSYTNLSWTGGVTINIGDKVGLLVDWTGSQTNISVYHNSTTYDGDGFPTDGQVVAPFADTSLSSGQAGLVARNISNTNQAFVTTLYTAGASISKTITFATDPVVDGSTGNSLIVASMVGEPSTFQIRVAGTGLFPTDLSFTGSAGTYSFDSSHIAGLTVNTLGTPFTSTYWTTEMYIVDGGDSISGMKTVSHDAKSGWTVVDVGSTITTTEGSIFYGWTGTPAQYDQILYPTANNTQIFNDGTIVTDATSNFTCFYFDQSDGYWKPVIIILSSGGGIISSVIMSPIFDVTSSVLEYNNIYLD